MSEPLPSGAPGAASSTKAGAAAATIAATLMSVLMYAFNLVAAHALGPSDFGAVSACLGITVVVNVGALALQATAARRIAVADPHEREGVAHDVAVSTWQVSAIVTAVLLAASPLIAHLLAVDYLTALFTSATTAPLTMLGGYAGILQGARRWWAFGWATLSSGVGRILVGALLIALFPNPAGAMAGVLGGAIVPVLVAGWSCRHVAHRRRGSHHLVLRETWRNGQTLLAYFTLTNLDVLVARHQLDHHAAGLYAAGSLITKVFFFLPQIALVVLFPAMAKRDGGSTGGSRRPALAIAGFGIVAAGLTAALRDLAVVFIGGDEYSGVAPYAWMFALEGTAFAVLQIAVYRQIARQAHVARWMWAAAVVIVVVGTAASSSRFLVAMMTVIIAALVVPVSLAKPTSSRLDQ